jgi:nucleotide-binding universal stress UspA family protein
MGGRILVGVDGSAGSVDALRWALDEARLRGAAVEVVHAWQYPYVGEIAGMAAPAAPLEALEASARAVLDETVEQAGGSATGLEMETSVVLGPAAPALLQRAEGADLLVVGSRGRGGFVGLLLGSVSQQCVQHAPCPVVVVPGADASD